MKHLIFAFFLTLVTSCAISERMFKKYDDKNPLKLDTVMKYTIYKEDKFKKTLFLTPWDRVTKGASAKNIKLRPYLGLDISKEKNKPYIRFQVNLTRSGWLFMHQIHFMCNNKDLKIKFKPQKISRSVNYGNSISEYIDFSLNEKQTLFLKKCKTGDKYRLSGKDYDMDASWRDEDTGFLKEVLFLKDHLNKKSYKSLKKYIPITKK